MIVPALVFSWTLLTDGRVLHGGVAVAVDRHDDGARQTEVE